MNPIDLLLAVLMGHQNLVVAGAQWGDEGKGKIAAYLAMIYDYVMRYSGAANAGHTAYTSAGRKVVSHLIPCGLAAGKPCIIGRGVMFDAIRFAQEYNEAVKILGDQMPLVLVDNQCTVWTPWHAMVEVWIESKRSAQGVSKINTTGRGVGPMAAIRAERYDIKVADLLGNKTRLVGKLELIYQVLRPILEAMSEDCPKPEAVADKLLSVADLIKDADTGYEMSVAMNQGKRILFEGAQATMLDLLWGTNPYVSAGMSTAAGAAYGTGLAPSAVQAVLLVAKFCPSRVGEGPFPSEIWKRDDAERFPKEYPQLFEPGKTKEEFLSRVLWRINQRTATDAEESQYFQVLGDERGASTGRGRSIGHCDLPILRYAQRINGAKYLALTRLDMMSGLRNIPIVMDYRLPNGSTMEHGRMLPTEELALVHPIIKEVWGWESNIHGMQNEDDLPSQAVRVIQRIESETGMHVLLVGTGPGRDDIIVRPPKAV